MIFTPCDRENHFLEIRSDGEGGWEVLAGVGGELRILGVRAVEPTADGVRIAVDEGDPLTITWVEPERTATITPLFPDDRLCPPAVVPRCSESRNRTAHETSGGTVKLYIGDYNLSSWSLRPWLALTHAGIPFDTERIPARTSRRPVLRCGGCRRPARCRSSTTGA